MFGLKKILGHTKEIGYSTVFEQWLLDSFYINSIPRIKGCTEEFTYHPPLLAGIAIREFSNELSTITVFTFSEVALSSILGHSGVVFHVDKYGHISGHSSHYDYRVFPEKVYLPLPLIDHHNIVGHHHELDDEHQEAFNLIEEEYHHKVHPIFYYAHHIDHENHHIDHDSHHLDHGNHHLDHEDHHSYHHLHHL